MDARGEILDLKNTVNGMVIRFVVIIFSLDLTTDRLVRLRALAAEVTRVTLEVGSQGKLGGQADVPDVEGVWLNLVRNAGVLANKFLLESPAFYRSIGCVLLLQTKCGQLQLSQPLWLGAI